MRMLAGLVLLAAATVASAQTPPGQFAPNPRGADRLTATEVMAQCIVRKNPPGATDYALATGTDMNRAWQRLTPAAIACVKSQSMTMQGAELQGALSEVLLKADGGALLVRAAAQAPVPPVRMARITNPTNPTGLMSCVAAADPSGAVAMLRAAPETTVEVTRFQALAPAFQACVPTAADVHLNPARIRFLLATALFRRAQPMPSL